MRVKVHGGTAYEGDTPLCHTCRYATIVRGTRLRDEIIECTALFRNDRIVLPVTFCNRYVNRRHPSLREMEDIAWVLRTDAHRNRVGFVHAQKLAEKDRYVLDED